MEDHIVVIVTLIIIIVVMLFPIGISIAQYINNEEIEIIVKDKYIKNNSNNGKYLVVDNDKNTYQITDLFFRWKFNSTDIYNGLEIGKTYKLQISGFRMRFLSIYPNINKIIEEVKDE